MANQTICGVSLDAFSQKPTPEELAAVVARWVNDDQAMFFISLAEQLKNCCGSKEKSQIAYIAQDLVEQEERLCDGGGSSLIERLAWFVHQYQKDAEAA